MSLSWLPEPVVNALREETAQVLEEYAAKDETTARVYAAYQKFSERVVGWTTVSEYAFLKARESSQ